MTPKNIIIASETLCMIYRYCYYILGFKPVEDDFYDRLEAMVLLSHLVPKSPLWKPGSSNKIDYIMPHNYPTIQLGEYLMLDPTYLDNIVSLITPYLPTTRLGVPENALENLA